MDSVIAVDLGGTKLATALIDSAGKVSRRSKRPVTRADVRACVKQIHEAVEDAASGGPAIRGVGVIVPGIYFSDSGNVWAPNLWGHDQVPFRSELERELNLAVVVDSDRAGYVIGERWLGAAKGLNDVVFLSIGTGIGAGIIAGGHLVRGAGEIAGAVGWFALNPNFQEVYRSVGCWEAESAGPALARRVHAPSAEDVIEAARKSDAAAERAVEQTARYLGMGVANIVSLLNPEMIVLGGGLMQSADLFLDTVKHVMAEWAQPVAARQVRITVTQLGEDAGLYGAARLAFDNLSVPVTN